MPTMTPSPQADLPPDRPEHSQPPDGAAAEGQRAAAGQTGPPELKPLASRQRSADSQSLGDQQISAHQPLPTDQPLSSDQLLSADQPLCSWQQLLVSLWAMGVVVLFVRLLAGAYLEALSH